MGVRSLGVFLLALATVGSELNASFYNQYVKPHIKVFFGTYEGAGAPKKAVGVSLLAAFTSVKGSYRIADGSIEEGFYGMVNRSAMFYERFKTALVCEEPLHKAKFINGRIGRIDHRTKMIEWFDIKKLVKDVFPAAPLLMVEDAFSEAVSSYIENIVEVDDPQETAYYYSYLNHDVFSYQTWCKNIVNSFTKSCLTGNLESYRHYFLTYFFHEVAHADYLVHEFKWKKFFNDQATWTRKIVVTYFFLKKLASEAKMLGKNEEYEHFFFWHKQIAYELKKIYSKIMKRRMPRLFSFEI